MWIQNQFGSLVDIGKSNFICKEKKADDFQIRAYFLCYYRNGYEEDSQETVSQETVVLYTFKTESEANQYLDSLHEMLNRGNDD
jgi:hypothetical protein